MKRDPAGPPTLKLPRRLFRLFTSPVSEWQQIDREDVSLRHLYVGWLLPLMLLVWLGLVSGQYLYGDAPALHHPLRLTRLLVLLGGGSLAFFVQFTLLALVTQLFAPRFGGIRHLRKAFAVVGYAMAGLLVAAALQPLLMSLFPLLMVLGGSWSVYLLLCGMPALLKVSPRGGRILSGMVVVLFLLTNMLLRPLADRVWESIVPPETEPAIVGTEGPALHQGDGRVLVPIEKIQQADRNLDEAAREAGSASARNDSLAAAQAARDAATALAATVSGGQERVPLTPAQLSDWFPSEILGLKLQSLQIEPWGGVSSRAVMAHGIYGRQGSTELDLRLIDPASAGALLPPVPRATRKARLRPPSNAATGKAPAASRNCAGRTPTASRSAMCWPTVCASPPRPAALMPPTCMTPSASCPWTFWSATAWCPWKACQRPPSLRPPSPTPLRHIRYNRAPRLRSSVDRASPS